MACVSRSTVCTSVPSNHFGKIPGIPVGSTWKYRIQVSEVGIHRPHVAGISGRENEGSFSLVLSGGYEDDIDRGSEFVYTGSGGRDLSGNKRCNVQSMDQVLTKQNGALARNCNPDFNKSLMKNKQFESKNWKSGLPVRVVRSYKLAKVSKYAPAEGFRYDGIYKIVKYWPEKGKSGFIIWRYLIRRDDPEPAPWTKEGKKYIKDLGLTIEYPPGYCDTNEESQGSSKSKVFDSSHPTAASYRVTNKLLNKIKKDEYNSKTWKNLLSEQYANRKEFTDAVSKFFTCICCLNILNDPVTLASCSHNICNNCLLESISCGIHKCPVCRMDINADTSNKEITFEINNTLKDILSDVFNDS
ncbi:MAG: ubiquitin-like with PHD and RING finger domains 2 [Marteilia pararefringens]